MPYRSRSALPESVRHVLPEHGQDIYKEAFNSAWEEYQHQKDREETAHRVAWSAVKHVYQKNADGRWVRRKDHK
ncbi:ChaB family protein [Entomohabitans teleogrylli]|uniref:ChaB family protein n=1 Tax=Entomohabitans teleogrylli TaxID=1384589 RepID=UPI00073DA2F9|nr:ChaB family protein [Entomohabitans teleogrylli]